MGDDAYSPSQPQRHALKAYVKLMRASSAVTRRLHAYLVDYGLTTSQFGVLEALYHLGPMHQKEIAAKILKTDGNITMVLNNLARRFLIDREHDPGDRRRITVRLTQEGRQLIETVFPIHVTRTERLFACLSKEELNNLGEILRKLGRQVSA
jgi:MarR family 2-MHQ and catechol resistance regulon transcriptional repressor